MAKQAAKKKAAKKRATVKKAAKKAPAKKSAAKKAAKRKAATKKAPIRPATRPKADATKAQAHRDYVAERKREAYAKGRDIGQIPPISVKHQAIRDSCEYDFKLYCETFHPEVFHLGWSDAHLVAIEKIERAVLHGGLFAVAMPRGSGKTSLCNAAAEWATLYGHRKFVVLVGADEGAGLQSLDGIKATIESNELIAACFPEVCYPVEKLEGIPQRANGQTCDGKRTFMEWTGKAVVFPKIKGAKTAGTILKGTGLTGAGIRGSWKKDRETGKNLRPDMVIVDDPQTDESANSVTQCDSREDLLGGAVLGMAGPGKKIAGIAPVTIIREDDMASRILDKERHPDWQGEVTSILDTMPTDLEIWDKYKKIRANSFREHGDIRDATAFYKKNRKAMDAGASPSWSERYEHDEISAIQHAMNLWCRDERAFWSEYMNKPKKRQESSIKLEANAIAQRLNGHSRLLVPSTAEVVTTYIDIQGDLLYYLVSAWGQGMSGHIIDYGSWPEQPNADLTLAKVKKGMAKATGIQDPLGKTYEALRRLAKQILAREYESDDGTAMSVDMCVIDTSYSQTAESVKSFCRQSTHRDILMPGRGRGIGPQHQPLEEQAKKGDRKGLGWLIPRRGQGRRRELHIDTNFWKTQTASGLLAPIGSDGSILVYGDNPEEHRHLANQMTAEVCDKLTSERTGKEVHVWKLILGRDNHMFDCLVGCMCAASILGIECSRWQGRSDRAPGFKRVQDREPKQDKKSKGKKPPPPPPGGGGFGQGGGGWLEGYG